MTNTFNDLTNEITDILDYSQKDKIKIIPLARNKKYPNDTNYYDKKYSLGRIRKHKGNLGIGIGYGHEEYGCSLAVVDIDGYTCTDPNVSESNKEYVKNFTKDYIFDCLKDLPGVLIVKTQSGGKHLYVWNRTVVDNIHNTSNCLHFPEDFPIKNLQGMSLAHSIEIFTKWKSKQCVLPGSTIKIKGENGIRRYSVISNVNRLSDVCVVDNVHELVKDTLVSKGFSYHKPIQTTEENPITNKDTVNFQLKNLSKSEIKKVVELLTPYFIRLVGQKNNSYFYLGGYLYKNVTKESTEAIVKGLLRSTNDDYPKHIKTALSNYEKEGPHKGLPSLYENIKVAFPGISKNELDKLDFELQFLTNPNFKHNILIKTFSKNKKQYLSIDYNNKEVSTFTFNKKEQDDGDEVIYYTNMYPILNFAPLDVYESYNILDKKQVAKTCLKFYRKGMPWVQTIEGADIESIEKQLKKRPGLVLKPKEFTGVINEIIKEYVRLDKLHILEEIPVQGIFLNPISGELCRANKEGIIDIVKPSMESVVEGLCVWKKLYKFYKGDKKKLSHILRYGLKCPFSYIFKTEYGWMPMLYLYGASKTAKTTLAEISLAPYAVIDEDISIGGAAFDTDYRIGYALSKQGIGTVVNEPKGIIESNSNLLNILKRAVESEFSREVQRDGIHTRVPCYSNTIFTSNDFIPSDAAFVRRCEYLEFTKSERMSEEESKEFYLRFHHVNWRDTDFLKLQAIGDFVVWFVSENLSILGCDPDVFCDKVLDALLSFAGEDGMGWLYDRAELMDMDEADEDILNNFRRMIMKEYNRLTSSSSQILKLASGVGELYIGDDSELVDLEDFRREEDAANRRFEQLFRIVVQHHYIDFLDIHQMRNGVKYIFVNKNVKYAFKDYNGSQVNCAQLADFMNKKHGQFFYKKKNMRGFRVEFKEFLEFLKG